MDELTCLKLLRRELWDLDVYDVEAGLKNRVFTGDELREIFNEQDESFRLELIFIMLESKRLCDPTVVSRFMDALRPYYDWIVERWEKQRQSDLSEYRQYVSYRNETSMPSHNSVGVFRRDLRWKIHKHLMLLCHGASQHRYLFIYGKIGTGKQTLVCQACEDITIVKRMGYHIFYLDLGYCRSKQSILEMQEKLSVQFGDAIRQDDRGINYSYPSNMIDYWKRTFTRLFEKEFVDSLLVLAHVRDANLINSFDFKCKTVVITSNKDVMHEVSEHERFQVELPKGFTEDECLELFAMALKKKKTMLPPEATELCRACQGNPFLINLIALRMNEEWRNEVQINWKQHIDNLENFSIGKSEKISRTIASTLSQFTEEEQQCYRDLVIFRDNVPLSPRVLEMYWKKNKETTECFLSKLERRGLLEKRVCKNRLFYMMQYICYNEIKHPTGSELKELHRRLLDSYSVREKFAHRRELELNYEFPNDDYFHFHIGYHIDQAGEHDIFQDLYQDFGFLEQKLRIAGLANTVGDLRKYQDHIFPFTEERQSMVETMEDFLMGAECLLTEDTRLLQTALNVPGDISDMAKLQVEKYKNRLWFRDVAHCFESSVIKLGIRPVMVRYHDSHHVFVSLANNDIQLWNLLVEYDAQPLTFKGCGGDQIKDVQKVNQFLMALTRRGVILIWSTKNPPLRSDHRKTSGDPREAMTLSIRDGFSCFCVLKQDNQTELIAISETGVLCIYRIYTTEYRTMSPCIPTSIRNAYTLLPLKDFNDPESTVVKRCLFLAEVHGVPMGIIFNMKSTSEEMRFVEPVALNVYQLQDGFLFVNETQVRFRGMQIHEPTVVYENRYCANTCSVLTEDMQFLVLGTKAGISILSIPGGDVVRRMNVSQSIVDLDVMLVQPTMQLASISKDGENAMNFYSLSLATNNQVVSSQYQLEGTSAFHARLDEEPVLLNTVDRNCTLKQTPLHDSDWGMAHDRTFRNDQMDAPVVCLIDTPSAYYFGLENGKLLRMTDWRAGVAADVLETLGTEVTYLDYFRREEDNSTSEIVVVAGEGICKVYVNDRKEKELNDTVQKSYLLYDRYLLLIGNRCSIQIYDLESGILESVQKKIERSYGAAACHQVPRSALILCTADGIVYHLGLERAAITSSDLKPFDALLTVKPLDNQRRRNVICSCALSTDGEFLAVGCCDGRIILHQIDQNQQLGVLESHHYPVEALYFSNWSEPFAPHILISVGEQIVFWSIDFLQNNPPQRSTSSVRLSGRFNPRKPQTDPIFMPGSGRRSTGSNQSTPLMGSPVQRSIFEDRQDDSAYWNDKRGSTAKPYLLSCIKLIGRAKSLIMNREFNKFLTIDDEGYIHYLRFYRPSSSLQLCPPPINFGMRSSNGPI